MTNQIDRLKARAQVLGDREWDMAAITARYEKLMGQGIASRKYHVNVVFGRNMDPGAGEENMEAFSKAKGFEKCGLAPGIGARIAAGIILDHLQERK